MKVSANVPVQRTLGILAWERAVPAFLPTVVVGACIFALLWTGTYAELPPAWHIAALILTLVIATVVLNIGLAKFRLPTQREALRRIEERNGINVGLLDGVFARSFAGDETDPLWTAAQNRLAQLIGKPKPPLPRIDWRGADPFRTRYGAMLVILLAIISTKGSQDGLRASLIPGQGPGDPVIVDAWVEPPAYTGQSSTVLKDLPPQIVRVVPRGSKLHVRLRREDSRPVAGVLTFQPSGERRQRISAPGEANGGATLVLDEDGTFAVTTGGQSRIYQFRARADRPPRVRVDGKPDTSTGQIAVDVTVEDDYPLADAVMMLELIPGQKLSLDAPMPDDRVLEQPLSVPLPDLIGPPGSRRIEADTIEHPWAGLLVKATIEVTDGVGQKAVSEPIAFTMPERTFYNPLSKAVIAERQKLAMAPQYLNKAAKMFRALTNAPDIFDVVPADHLMLKATAEAVDAAKQRDVEDLISSLWPLAIELEDDGLAFAKARLDAAQKALRDALRNGAEEEELSQRIAELKDAMNAYLRALAESGLARAEPQSGQRTMAQTDLEDLLARMAELAESGAREEAEQLLRQLEALLQSLQLAEGGGEGGQQSGGGGQGGFGGAGASGSGSGGSQGERALGAAGDLIQRQRELADQTFSARRGDRGTDGLPGDQGSLADELGELGRGLPGGSGEAQEAFKRAEEAMRDAAKSLERGNLSAAQRLQEQALSALRDGGQELAEMLDSDGKGDRGGAGGSDEGTLSGSDPFGRAWSGENGPEAEDFGLYDPERIRALISEIRKRLEDPKLGEAERQYLESLLERF